MNKSELFWQTYLSLEKEAIELSKFIYITDVKKINGANGYMEETCRTQLDTFSPYLADLLIRCCVEIEAISKELYFKNGGTKKRGDKDLYFDDDCLKLMDIKWGTGDKSVQVIAPTFEFKNDENRILKPLKRAYKRQGTYWERAYQAVKHDRYTSLYKGNVRAFIQALAALFLLNLYYRNDSWKTDYNNVGKIDFSLGSRLFAVQSPRRDLIWYENSPQISESPYALFYEEEEYKKIKEMQERDNEAVSDYWLNQPEINETEFIDIINNEMNKQKHDPNYRVLYLWELGKYRIKKKIPETLSFEKKKELLVNSEEWNCEINRMNKHLSVFELDESNIDGEIENVGRRYGMEIERDLRKSHWEVYAISKAKCEVRLQEKT